MVFWNMRAECRMMFAALEKLTEDAEEDGEGTMQFMVNVVQPQFNLDSEEANVCILLT
jgi:hypothetical protein